MSININRVLPKHLTVKWADQHLYRIGLSHESNGQTKRKFLCDPRLITLYFIIYFIQNNLNLFVIKEDLFLSKVFGNYGLFLGIGSIFNVIFNFVLFIINFINKLTHNYNHKYEVKPTFLRVFRMMSGSLTPQSVGLTNTSQVFQLTRKTRILFKIIEFNNDWS